jgi:hypothetical protein
MNGYKTGNPSSTITSPEIWFLITICSIVMVPMSTLSANAQMLPPPVPNLRIQDEELESKETQFQLPKVFEPPLVEVITEELRDGKNVFKINITSEAPIEDCKVTFTKDYAERTVDCVRDIGTVFKALIDARQPNQTIYIKATDLYGDSSSTVAEFSVLPELTIDKVIWNSLNSFIKMTEGMIQYIILPMNSIHFL